METIANRLKEAMGKRKMLLITLSEKTGIDKGSISHYRKGDYLPKQNNIYLLARALDVSEAWLMGYDVPMERDTTPPAPAQSPDDILAFALFGDSAAVTAEDLDDIRKFAEYIKARRHDRS